MALLSLTILSTIGKILLDKGLECISDLLAGLTDEGVKKAKSLIQDKTGIDITDAQHLTHLTKEQTESLKSTILNNSFALLEIKQNYREQDLENTISARDMHIELAQLGTKGVWTFTNVLALLWTTFAMVMFPALVFGDIPQANTRFADTIIGFLLGSVVGVVINFYFGSSMTDTRTREVTMTKDPNSTTKSIIDGTKDVIKKTFKKE